MKHFRAVAATAATLVAICNSGSALAQAPNPSQFLQGLLSGNQNQDSAVRDAFERGYRQGRDDQARADRDRGASPSDRRRVNDPSRDQGYQPNPYGR